MLTGIESTPKCTAGAPYDHDQQAVIIELHLERSVERSSGSDIMWLVRFSSEHLVHCILLLNCLFSYFISSKQHYYV